MAMAATRLIAFRCADLDDRSVVRSRFAINQTLAHGRWGAALHADGGQLGNEFGFR